MKKIDTYDAINAYASAKKVEEKINTNANLPFNAIVEVDKYSVGFFIVNKKDYDDAILKGINAIDNKSLIACMDFDIPDDLDSYDEVETFRKALRVVSKIWLRSLDIQ